MCRWDALAAPGIAVGLSYPPFPPTIQSSGDTTVTSPPPPLRKPVGEPPKAGPGAREGVPAPGGTWGAHSLRLVPGGLASGQLLTSPRLCRKYPRDTVGTGCHPQHVLTGTDPHTRTRTPVDVVLIRFNLVQTNRAPGPAPHPKSRSHMCRAATVLWDGDSSGTRSPSEPVPGWGVRAEGACPRPHRRPRQRAARPASGERLAPLLLLPRRCPKWDSVYPPAKPDAERALVRQPRAPARHGSELARPWCFCCRLPRSAPGVPPAHSRLAARVSLCALPAPAGCR